MIDGIYTETALAEAAQTLAQELTGHETVFLTGPLGAGKTTFARAFVTALAADTIVSSPTFQLINEYELPNKKRIVHADLYRLQNPDDVITLGLDDYFADPNTITIVEWPELGSPHLPRPDLHLQLAHRDPSTRHLKVTTYSDHD